MLRLDWPAYPIVMLFWLESVTAVAITALCLRRRRRAQDGALAGLRRMDSRWVVAMLGCCVVLGLFILFGLGGEWASRGENRVDIVQWDPLQYLDSAAFTIGVLGVLGGRVTLYLRERSACAARSADAIVAVFVALVETEPAAEGRARLAVTLIIGMAIVDGLLAFGVTPLRLKLDD